jgi:chromosome condensin MukBEF complex kleisin-like MukF subunit
MALFHSTLSDALEAARKGDTVKAKKILVEHYDTEVKENDFLESSIFALKVYLQNYTSHLKQAIDILAGKELTADDLKKLAEHIDKCKENIQAFEDGTKELLEREGSLN